MPNLMFYKMLPLMEDLPEFYVPGYTETLKLVPGTRIVPNEDFIEDLADVHKLNFRVTGFPCYYIPIKRKREHFGYILKSQQKRNPHYSNWLNIFNLDAIYDSRKTLFVTEGIKDTYLFLKYKLPVIACLTSTLSEDVFVELKKQQKRVIFIPDNDSIGKEQGPRFFRKASSKGIKSSVFLIKGHKDFGDWFDYPDNQKLVTENFVSCIKLAKSLGA